MKLHDDRFRPLHGYEEGKVDAIDVESSTKALAYKKDFLKHFIPLEPGQLDRRLGGDRYFVTRKYDGEYAMIIHDDDRTVTVNRSGRIRRGLPCIEEAGRLLRAAGISQAMVAAEMYVEKGRKRARVNDLLAALADKKRIATLRLAVFDLVELDGRAWREADFGKTWARLRELFAGGDLVRVVEMEPAASSAGVREIYDRWVTGGGAEGVVVRSMGPFVYKIKPRHSIDAVVVGFSEGAGGEQGQVRSLLLALMPSEGRYQVVGRVGSGLGEELRELLYDRLSAQAVASDFVETDNNLVAFRMVRPELVVEVTVGDLLFETESGPKTNPVLALDGGAYRIAGNVEGVKFLAPVFVRIRTDKRADAGDVRLAQIERFAAPAAAPPPPAAPARELAPSRTIFREVYRKTLGSKLMLQKYLVWKTNKEDSGDFPAYVLYCLNYSSGRLEPLQREVRISSSERQIREMLTALMAKNLRGGWKRVAAGEPPAAEGAAARKPEPDAPPRSPRKRRKEPAEA